MDLGSAVSFPSSLGGAPAKLEFGAFYLKKWASGDYRETKNRVHQCRVIAFNRLLYKLLHINDSL